MVFYNFCIDGKVYGPYSIKQIGYISYEFNRDMFLLNPGVSIREAVQNDNETQYFCSSDNQWDEEFPSPDLDFEAILLPSVNDLVEAISIFCSQKEVDFFPDSLEFSENNRVIHNRPNRVLWIGIFKVYSKEKEAYKLREKAIDYFPNKKEEILDEYEKVTAKMRNLIDVAWKTYEARIESDKRLNGNRIYNLNSRRVRFFGKTYFVHSYNHWNFDKGHFIVDFNPKNAILESGLEKGIASLICQIIRQKSPGKVIVSMIDLKDMRGMSDVFRQRDKNYYRIIASESGASKLISDLTRLIEDRSVNILSSYPDLDDFNKVNGFSQDYHVLVVKSFPFKLSDSTVGNLNTIIRLGGKVGIQAIIATNMEENREIVHRLMDGVTITSSIPEVSYVDNVDIFTPILLGEADQIQIVQAVNEQLAREAYKEEKPRKEVDKLPDRKDWWVADSSNAISIPFGIDGDNSPVCLQITQQNGQNCAIVIGMPGSGKSAFLHSVICNAVAKYSPDELALYLIDFSGVEFNTYATHKLPHARVIAPEAEREFGRSTLNELYEEGIRRMNLCRENEVDNIVNLRQECPHLHLPRLLVIIDEFQKIFEIENDEISKDSRAKIEVIIREYRKFGINLILSTQTLPSSYVLPKDMISNRVVFKSSPNDFAALLNSYRNGAPKLGTGDCIYNWEAGDPSANAMAHSFYFPKKEIDSFLDSIAAMYKEKGGTDVQTIVFKGNDLPDFSTRKISPEHMSTSSNPEETGIYFGESISISTVDVNVTLMKENGDNIAILGGEQKVAQRIAYYSALSATTAYEEQSASFRILSFLRSSDDLNSEMASMFQVLPFDTAFASRTTDVTQILGSLKSEIETRRTEEGMNHPDIFLVIIGFQQGRAFDLGGRRGDEPSDCGKMLEFILRNGPQVGVMTILQVDRLNSLNRICFSPASALQLFNYRVALQMDERDSNSVMDSPAASKLFQFNRPSSVYRAFLRDNGRNTSVKFKPYK